MASIIIKNSTISFNKEDGNKRTQITGYPTVGTIISWAGNNISHLNNTKYLICYGQALTTSDYPELFNVIGYRYGGSETTFYLPDFMNRYPAGSDSTSTLKLDGEEAHKGGDYNMSNSHFPHNHSIGNVTFAIQHARRLIDNGSDAWRFLNTWNQFNRTSTNPLNSSGVEQTSQKPTLPKYTILSFIIKALP